MLRGRLDLWKEIASYLNRSEKTVRRWEESEGLPVHRLLHEKRSSVYAYTDELDAWWKSRKLQETVSAEPPNERLRGVEHEWSLPRRKSKAILKFAADARRSI